MPEIFQFTPGSLRARIIEEHEKYFSILFLEFHEKFTKNSTLRLIEEGRDLF